ncbi:MAG: ATP-binding cassette domain-containing protein [Chloroflexi bacterium]|nr:ATP-binding cassette domain-containing protein [Chloroflexota bacterium]
MPLVQARDLRKVFIRHTHGPGIRGALQGLFRRQSEPVVAVDGIDFDIEAGEFIGFIGPNGAGKSTTIKMLSGILVPTSGELKVDGLVPHRDRRINARKIGVVFGQRSQLWWDLPIPESYNLLRYIYGIPQADYDERIAYFRDLLGLDEFWTQPVRELSLGQRMRGEVGAALLHRPKLLYLDEPTIGMDALVKERLRHFLVDTNRRDGVTILLTTHDLDEIERSCRRVMLINRGKLLFDGQLENLRAECSADTVMTVLFGEEPPADAFEGLQVLERDGARVTFGFRRGTTASGDLINALMSRYTVRDIKLTEPSVDVVVSSLYGGGEGSA